MDVDKLLIVAHPDDELLWGGINLLLEPGWKVVCATNATHAVRSKEFYKTMSFCNVFEYDMYNAQDVYTDEEDESDDMFRGTDFENILTELSRKHWKLVLTHSPTGEYGHEHHKTVHRMVKSKFPEAKNFTIGPKLSPARIRMKQQACIFYAATQDICRKFLNDGPLREIERDFITKESIYVCKDRQIPRVIHQIWFGNEMNPESVRGKLLANVKRVAESNGYVYKLWGNADLTEKNFPLTWNSITTARQKSAETGQSRFAQIADLARYEIIHRFGGVYLDSLFEIGAKFCEYIQSESKAVELIVANEDACGLECQGSPGEYYMSNGFFAAIPGCIVLKRLLHPATQSEIDFDEKRVNRTTGPYFFRSGIRDDYHKKVHVIPTEKIYPFMSNDSDYREGDPGKCLTADKRDIIPDCLMSKYPESLAVYHSGFGGSWSW